MVTSIFSDLYKACFAFFQFIRFGELDVAIFENGVSGFCSTVLAFWLRTE